LITRQIRFYGKNTGNILQLIGIILMMTILTGSGCTPGKALKKPDSVYTESANPFVRMNIPDEKPQQAPVKPPIVSLEPVKEAAPKTNLRHIAAEKPAPPKTTAKPGDGKKKEAKVHVELAFDNADLYEVLDLTLYDLFGVSYMVDPTLKAMVTFHIAGDYTRDEFINLLNNALQLNSLSIVNGPGSIYKVTPKPSSGGAGGALVVTDDNPMTGDVTRLIRLRYVGVAAAAANIIPFLSKGAVVVQDMVNNSLLVTDTNENLTKAVAILGVIDVEYFSDISWQIFPIKDVDVNVIAADLESVLKSGGLYTRQGTVEGALELFPIRSMNAILVVTRWPNMLKLVQDWIAAMDQGIDSETNVFVYFVENGSAMELAEVLGQIFGSKVTTTRSSSAASRSKPASTRSTTGLTKSTPSTTAQKQTLVNPTAASSAKRTDDGLVENVEVIPDEANNAIVFKASKRDYKLVQTILKQLDIVPRQVLINVLIAEISLSGSIEYGIEWFLNKNVGKLGSQDGDYTVQGALDNSLARAINTPLGSANGFFFSVYDPVEFLRSLVYALGSDSDVNILSSPNILALDNREAIIEVGNEIPTATGTTSDTTTGTKTTTSVQYRKTGVLLTVTPHINSSGLVKMELVQEVSDIGEFVPELSNYIILTRRADTSLVVEDGQTVVIAGLMKSNSRNSNSGIPFLKDIPILGYLFGGASQEMQKTELIIMITPHVIKNRTDAETITWEFSNKIKTLQRDKILSNP